MEPSLNKDGWSSVTTPCETGLVFLTNNPNGSGYSLQPLFSETDSSNHIILIIGTYYPKGSIPFEDENFRSELISKCKEELGDSYDLDVSFLNFTPETYNIEFRIFKNN